MASAPAVQCPCPSCRTVLQIGQALPAAVQCPRCGTTFTVAPPGASPPVHAAIAPGAPRIGIPVTARSDPGRSASRTGRKKTKREPARSRKGPLVMLGAAGATLLIGAVVLIIVLSSGGSDTGAGDGN